MTRKRNGTATILWLIGPGSRPDLGPCKPKLLQGELRPLKMAQRNTNSYNEFCETDYCPN